MEDVPDRLIVIHGSNLGQQYELTGEEFSIGRSTNNDIVLSLPEISRRHARLWKEKDAYFLEDLGSTNGTYVNDVRLFEPVKIFHGDEIQIGDTFRVLVTSEGGAVRTTAVAEEEEDEEKADAAILERPHLPEPQPQAADIAQDAAKAPAEAAPAPEIVDDQAADSGARRTILACGCAAIILLGLCVFSIFFLDQYQGGRLLYCGGFRPVFEFLLGPFGFNPLCV